LAAYATLVEKLALGLPISCAFRHCVGSNDRVSQKINPKDVEAIMKSRETFSLRETLFGVMSVLVLLLVPAFGQQETDPSWYDPWAKPSPAVAQAVPLPTAHAKPQTIAAHTTENQKKQASKRKAPHSSAVRTAQIEPAKDATLQR
jgi:hypothetical protein